MISAWGGRVVPMVGSNDQQVVFAEPIKHLPQLAVELLEVGRIACHIVAMTVLRIKIDEIREYESVSGVGHDLRNRLNAAIVAAGRQVPLRPAAGKEIGRLAD